MGTGLSHMEWFRRPDGWVAVSEVGARPPGAQITSLISYAHDFDFYRGLGAGWWCSTSSSRRSAPTPPAAPTCAARARAAIRAVHGIEAALARLGDLVVEKRLPQVGARPPRATRATATSILRHRETRAVEEALDDA